MNVFSLWLNSLRYSLRHPIVRASIIANLVVWGIILITLVAYWRPAERQTNNLTKTIEQKRRETRNAIYAENVAQAYAKSAKEVVALEKKLNIDAAQASLVKNLGLLAKKENAKILSEAYEEGKEQGDYIPLHLQLTLQGNYISLRKFILGLETLPTWSMVQEVTLSRESENGNENIKAYLRLITYRRNSEHKAYSN